MLGNASVQLVSYEFFGGRSSFRDSVDFMGKSLVVLAGRRTCSSSNQVFQFTAKAFG